MIEGLPTLPETTTDSSDTDIIDPSLTYRYIFETNEISGNIDDEEAVNQAISKILLTDRFSYVIYDGNYGQDFKLLIGRPYEYVITDFPRMVKEALLVDERILEVSNFRFSKIAVDSVQAIFDVRTIYSETTHSQVVGI